MTFRSHRCGHANACPAGESRLQTDAAEAGSRRGVLVKAAGAGLGMLLAPALLSQEDPRSRRPQAGDRLVFASGDRKGQTLKPADVQIDARPLIAYPQDPQTSVVRDGSRLNQVLLLRLDPQGLASETRTRSADGIVGYSAVCTHAGCDDWAWMQEKKTLKCPCHDSEFNPGDAARVVVGPATRRLSAVPLRIADGLVVLAGGFTGRVGIQE